MKEKRLRFVFAAALAVIIATLLIRTFARAGQDPPDQDEDDQEEAVKMPSHVMQQNGKQIVKLSSVTARQVGIVVMSLTPAIERREVTAPAVVIPVQDLVTLAGDYAAGEAALRKAENDLKVSRAEYQRLKTLFANHENVSEKAYQAALGLFRNDQADVAAARQNLDYQAAGARQNWGEEVARWVTGNSPALQRILAGQDGLVQMTLPAGTISGAPGAISLGLAGGKRATARLVGSFPRVDPRIQGASFLYKTPARGELIPGLNLIAYLSSGKRLRGVAVPASAVVWWRGEAWIYRQTGAGEFARQTVATDFPVAGGFFETQGLSPGERIVASGAQALLSEELRSEIQPED